MKFKTSLDKLAKAITFGITILFAIIIIGQFALIKDAGKAIPIFTTVALLFIYFGAFVFRPVSYEITKGKLIIQRPIKNVAIPREKIISVSLLDKHIIDGAIRTFGVGGLFGYFGKFSKFGFGSMTWYATRRDNLILVLTNDRQKIILTPDEPDLFIKNFNA